MERLTSRARVWALSRGALALAVAAPLALAHGLGFFTTAQITASDLLFKTRPTHPARSTVIVGIDQHSYRALLAEHGPLSHWPRTLYARALEVLRGPAGGASGAARGAGPRVVAFEVFFDGARPEDTELARAMREAGNVISAAGLRNERPQGLLPETRQHVPGEVLEGGDILLIHHLQQHALHTRARPAFEGRPDVRAGAGEKARRPPGLLVLGERREDRSCRRDAPRHLLPGRSR